MTTIILNTEQVDKDIAVYLKAMLKDPVYKNLAQEITTKISNTAKGM